MDHIAQNRVTRDRPWSQAHGTRPGLPSCRLTPAGDATEVRNNVCRPAIKGGNQGPSGPIISC